MADDGFTKIETQKTEVHRGDDKIPRDRYGRYLLPDPETGKGQAWTRVTTIAGTLKDRYGLERWDQRNVVWGMGQRRSLWATAAAAKLTDVKTLDKVADRAKEAADSLAGADLGSAIHTFAERVDRGEDYEVPEPFAADIAAYRQAMAMAEIKTAMGWIERVVVIPEIQACGTLDRLNTHPQWRLPRIGDIKSAADKVRENGSVTDPITSYGMQDIPLQMAMYAHGTHWWDIDNEQWVEMPPVDRSKAIIFHVPALMGECRIYEIDIEAGWEAVAHAMWDREWRKRKDLYELVLSIDSSGEIARAAQPEGGGGKASTGKKMDAQKGTAEDNGSANSPSGGEAGSPPADDPPASPSPPPGHQGLTELDGVQHPMAPTDPARWAWARSRVNDLKTHPEARRRLAGLWSMFDHIPLFPNEANPDREGPRNWAELSRIIGLCDLVEMEFSLPFPSVNDPNPDVPMPTPAEQRKAAAATKPKRTRKEFKR